MYLVAACLASGARFHWCADEDVAARKRDRWALTRDPGAGWKAGEGPQVYKPGRNPLCLVALLQHGENLDVVWKALASAAEEVRDESQRTGRNPRRREY